MWKRITGGPKSETLWKIHFFIEKQSQNWAASVELRPITGHETVQCVRGLKSAKWPVMRQWRALTFAGDFSASPRRPADTLTPLTPVAPAWFGCFFSHQQARREEVRGGDRGEIGAGWLCISLEIEHANATACNCWGNNVNASLKEAESQPSFSVFFNDGDHLV